ncbi:hypothetical protein F2Q70_00043166 [Brassica cretica]|uniref:Uncharacterized protein n=1 Tax=Brassica cretica TaxID=69181 RepID=A0A8S9KE96_BRACR|nr:hypothetical protein F2Q70_00043166 [Brassica cretica]
MKRVRGFKIGHRSVKIFKWIRSRRIRTMKRQYRSRITNPIAGIRSLARCLSHGAKRLCGGKNDSGQGQIRLVNWASDVSEARRSRQERRGSSGEKEASGVGVDPMGNKSGYGSEPGYRGDVEFGYGDEYDDEEEDVKLLFWERVARDFYTILNELQPVLSDNAFHHFILATDNILAASVVVSSAVQVNGAVETCRGDDEWVMSKRLRNYFNFSHPLIAKHLDPEECG